jgi:hypothetical protein
MNTEYVFSLSFPDGQLDAGAVPFGFDHDGFRHDAFSFLVEYSLLLLPSGKHLLGGSYHSLGEEIDDQDEKKSEIEQPALR